MMNVESPPPPTRVTEAVAPKQETAKLEKSAWPDYMTIWRWHFYAGVLCIPILIVLSVTGTIYLFKAQLQAIQHSKYQALVPASSGVSLTIADQVRLALVAIPGSRFTAYELPPDSDGSSQNSTAEPTKLLLEVEERSLASYQNPSDGRIIGQQYQDELLENTAKKIHGELLLGKRGSYLVETTACWTLVMVLTGLALWWPRTGWRLSGMVIPRFRIGGRTFWKDLHSVSGFWVSGLVVFLIVSGLPWATFWGDYFRSIRKVTGTAVAKQDWSSGHGRKHGSAHHEEPERTDQISYQLGDIDQVVAFARAQNLSPPVFIRPPQDKKRIWTIQSETQNRPLRTTIKYDVDKAEAISRDDFSKKHWIDQMVGQGIALHEGARFGAINQLLSLVATSGLVLLSGTALVMWWSRRQVGLGAPMRRGSTQYEISTLRRAGLCVVLLLMAVAMPLFGLSLLIVWSADRIILRRISPLSHWLGLSQ